MLFAAAARGGAVIAEASPALEQGLHDYGLNIGIAFQLIDDVLDYTGDPAEMGKNIGDDLSEGKPTLPLIRAMATASTADAGLISQAIKEKSSAQLAEIVNIVQNCGALDYTSELAETYRLKALEGLKSLPASPFVENLLALADKAVRRAA